MRFHIPSFLTGTLIGILLLSSTLIAVGKVSELTGVSFNIQQDIPVVVQAEIPGSDDQMNIPLTMTLNLEVSSLSGETARLIEITDQIPPAEVTQSEGEPDSDSGSNVGIPNVIRNIDPPTIGGLKIYHPGIQTRDPMIFKDKIGIALKIHSFNAKHRVAGAGIESVKFTVIEKTTSYGKESDKVVHEHTETISFFCLFGGNTMEECKPKTFSELDNQWPSTGEKIRNGEYQVNIEIETDEKPGTWVIPFTIEGAN